MPTRGIVPSGRAVGVGTKLGVDVAGTSVGMVEGLGGGRVALGAIVGLSTTATSLGSSVARGAAKTTSVGGSSGAAAGAGAPKPIAAMPANSATITSTVYLRKAGAPTAGSTTSVRV